MKSVAEGRMKSVSLLREVLEGLINELAGGWARVGTCTVRRWKGDGTGSTYLSKISVSSRGCIPCEPLFRHCTVVIVPVVQGEGERKA